VKQKAMDYYQKNKEKLSQKSKENYYKNRKRRIKKPRNTIRKIRKSGKSIIICIGTCTNKIM
jgi:hypothetical protein